MHPQSTIPRTCQQCQTTFYVIPSKVRGDRPKYCSAPCYRLASRKPRRSLADRFWSRVERHLEGCWLWVGRRDSAGYGVIGVGGGGAHTWYTERAHRVAWLLAYGTIPEGLIVRHRVCDNPPCCRPDHLALGTHADNSADALEHGLIPRGDQHPYRRRPELVRWGEQHNLAKLTWEQVRAIRARYAAGGITQAALGQEYGVSRTTVSAIIQGRNWPELSPGTTLP